MVYDTVNHLIIALLYHKYVSNPVAGDGLQPFLLWKSNPNLAELSLNSNGGSANFIKQHVAHSAIQINPSLAEELLLFFQGFVYPGLTTSLQGKIR